MPTVLYSADLICPMTGPPLPKGGVLVRDDRVIAVGDAATLRADADRVVYTRGVLLPGLVDAHSCLELGDAHPLAKPGPQHSFVEALAGLVAGWDADRWTRSAHRGVQQALRAGATTVGDVVLRGVGVPAAGRAGLVGDSWVNVEMVDRAEQEDVLAALGHTLGLPAAGRRVGVASGGPHTLGTGVLRALCALAQQRQVPLRITAAASQAEVRALWSGDGPLADLARDRGLDFEWLAGGTELTPVRYLAQLGALTPGTTLAGGVWVEDAEARLLAELGVGMVCRPRADALLQAGALPLEGYGQAGVGLALGTGGGALAPDGDVLAEAAAWTAAARGRGLTFWPTPAGPVPLEEAALRLATVDGATAMGWGDRAGVLEPGRRADFVVVQVTTTADRVWRDVVADGAGRQVLTVLGGVRKARRPDAEGAWSAIDHELEVVEGST